jgi:hypothetical protein
VDPVQRRVAHGVVAALDVLGHRPRQAADAHATVPRLAVLGHGANLLSDQLHRLEVTGRGNREALNARTHARARARAGGRRLP